MTHAWRTLALLRWWSIRGVLRRTARLARKPRYALGLLAAVAYFYWFVGRPLLGGGDIRSVNLGAGADRGLHLAVAAALGLYLCLAWLLSRRDATVKIKSADFHLLMPAPMPRRTLLAYTLLQQIPKLLLVALILGLVMSAAGGLGERVRHTGTLMLFFIAWDMFSKSRGVFKHRMWSVSPVLLWLSQGAALLWAVGLVAAMRRGALRFFELAAAGDPSTKAFWMRMSDELPRAVEQSPAAWTLKPFTFLTASRLSGDPTWAWVSLAAGLALTAAMFGLLVWAGPGFNESQVVSAVNRRTRREEGLRRRSPRMRRARPFPLAPVGRPEIALWWKHLLATTRFRLWWMALAAAGAIALLMAIVAATGAPRGLTGVLMGSSVIIACMLPFFAGISGNSGFVRDLRHLEAVRTWPVEPRAMARGQAMHSAMIGLLGAAALFALALATHITARALGVGPEGLPLPNGFLERFGVDPSVALAVLFLSVWPGLTGVAFVSSQLEGATGLFLPGWLMTGERRRGDPAAFGTRIIYGIAFFFVLAVALVPTGLMAVGLGLAVSRGWTPGLWAYPLLGLVLAAPLLAEAVGMGYLGGRLWRGLDPSQEVLEGFE